MKMKKLTKFDAAEYLDTEKLQSLYLDEVAKEMTKTAKAVGISRE